MQILSLVNKFFKRRSSKTYDEREEEKENKHKNIYPKMQKTSRRRELKKTTSVNVVKKSKDIECVESIKDGEYSRFFP